MRYHEFLTEMMWADRFEGARQAQKYPRDFIHFTNIPKLGVHPSKDHRDPPGIYFYPCRWLFTEEPSLSQFATEYKYFYIVRFKRDANFINLGKITMPEVEQIATANGWIDELRAVATNPKILQGKIRELSPGLRIKPGGIFYATLDYLANSKGKPWLPMLKGYHGLYDPGRGIISGGEVAQAVVFGRQWFTILAQGENTDRERHEYADILKRLASEYNGRFYYHNNVPMVDFVIDGKPIRMELELEWYKIIMSFYQDGFWTSKIDDFRHQDVGSKEIEYRSLKGFVESTAKIAERNGMDIYWNADRLRALFEAVKTTIGLHIGVDEKDQDLRARNGGYFSGSGSNMNARVDRSGKLSISATIDIGDHHIEEKLTFDAGTTVTQVANTILDKLAAKCIQTFKNKKLLGTVLNRYFRFGDRFAQFESATD